MLHPFLSNETKTPTTTGIKLSQRKALRRRMANLLLVAAILFGGPLSGFAQSVSFNGATLTQDFNTLPSSASPSGLGPFELSTISGTTISSLTGWFVQNPAGPSNMSYRSDDGNYANATIVSYGTTSSSDRALGGVPSVNTSNRYGIVIKNTTGFTLTNFTVTYTGEEWRNGGGGNTNTLAFAYNVGASTINATSGTWVTNTNLDFTNPIWNSSPTSTDGNNSTYRILTKATITGISWPAGTYLTLRWDDAGHSGKNNGDAIDDFSFSSDGIVTTTVSPSTYCISSGSGASISIPFTASGPFVSGNTFTAQLSDASGSFSSPTNIGTLSSSSTGNLTINGTIPAGTPAGTGYRVRVISDNPSITGLDNGSNLTVAYKPSAYVVSSQGICKGQSISLGTTSISGHTYSWSGGTSASSSNPNVAPTVTTIYNLTETITATGCSNSNSTTITVNALPSATVASNATICNGQSVSIGATAVSGSTYSWSDGTNVVSTSSNPSVAPSSNTTYTLTETVTSSGCTNSHNMMVTVNAVPAASIISNTSLCAGQSIYLGATAVSGNTYSWSDGSSLVSTSSNPSVAPSATTMYTLTEKITATGCTNSKNVTITVNTLPAATVASAQTICSGKSVSLGATAVTGNTYNWSDGSSVVSTSSNPSVSPSSTTTYTLTETVTATGCANSHNVKVTVNSTPAASVTSNKTICNGQSASIGATAISGNTYSWSDGSATVSTSSNPNVSPSATTIYTLTETVTATGCTNSNNVTVTVNALPAATVAANSSICNGQSISLGAVAVSGNTYSWSNGTNVVSTSSNPRVSPSATTTYTLTETVTTTGCTNSHNVKITVNPIPVASVASNKTICNGQSASIGGTAVTGNTYSWSDGTNVVSTSSNPSVAPSSNTTYTLTETITATGCTNSHDMSVTVNAIPAASVISNTSLCGGQSTSLGATAVTGNTYSWSDGSSVVSTSSNPSVTPSKTTTYTLTEKITATGCVNSNYVTITVNALPSATAGGSQTICQGRTVSLGTGAISGNTYSWNDGSSVIATSSNPDVTPSATTTYTLTEKVTSTGCTNSKSVTLTVNPLPVLNTGGDKSICPGAGWKAMLGTPSVSGHSYSWSPAAGLSTTSSAITCATPSATTTYKLTETITATGCMATDSVKVTVNSNPEPIGLRDTTMCSGDSIPVGFAGRSGFRYEWPSNARVTDKTISNPKAFPISSTTYWLSEVNTTTGCYTKNYFRITVNKVPTVNPGADKAICAGKTLTLGGAAIAGNSYSWSPAADLSDASKSNPVFNGVNTAKYTLTVTNTFGCAKSRSVTVTVNPVPVPDAGFPVSVCAGTSATIGYAGTPDNTYTWAPAATVSSINASNTMATPVATTTYTLTEKNSFGCTAKASVKVTVNKLPRAYAGMSQSIYSGKTVTLGTSAVAGHTYSWSNDTGSLHLVCSKIMVSPKNSVTYYLTEMDTLTGCAKTNSVDITILPDPTPAPVMTSVQDAPQTAQEETSLSIYPNPMVQTATLSYTLSSPVHVFITVIDINGKVVANIENASQAAGKYNYTLDADRYDLPTGMYIVKMIAGEQILTKQIIRTR